MADKQVDPKAEWLLSVMASQESLDKLMKTVDRVIDSGEAGIKASALEHPEMILKVLMVLKAIILLQQQETLVMVEERLAVIDKLEEIGDDIPDES